MPYYKLTYWDAKGLAEPSRLIFAYAGVDFEDKRIPIGTLTAEKKEELRLTVGYLPSLDIDDKTFTHSHAIARYLANKFGLVGDTELESLRIEELVYCTFEYLKLWVPLFYGDIPDTRKDEYRQKMLEMENPIIMDYFNNILIKNQQLGNQWLVGNRLSYADIVFAHVATNFERCLYKRNILEKYPKLDYLRNQVYEQPGIKDYVNGSSQYAI